MATFSVLLMNVVDRNNAVRVHTAILDYCNEFLSVHRDIVHNKYSCFATSLSLTCFEVPINKGKIKSFICTGKVKG